MITMDRNRVKRPVRGTRIQTLEYGPCVVSTWFEQGRGLTVFTPSGDVEIVRRSPNGYWTRAEDA